MDMKSSNVQEVKKVEEIDHENYPETMKPEEPEKILDAIRVSALVTMLKSLRKISLFISDEEEHKKFAKDYIGGLHDQFLSELSRTNPLEENAAFEVLITILDLLPPYNTGFKVYEVSKKNCNRCRMNTEYPPECSYGIIINADSLRDIKAAFKHFMFESIIKVIRINLKMDCEKKRCGKRNYVQRMINDELPSIFTIGIEWENNETKKEISDTISVLETEIDISKIYKYEGDSTFTRYHLVSMVCLCGDEYNCVAYENKEWVRYFRSDEIKVIGDWKSLVRICEKENIRPKILFFENVTKRDKLVKLEDASRGFDESGYVFVN